MRMGMLEWDEGHDLLETSTPLIAAVMTSHDNAG